MTDNVQINAAERYLEQHRTAQSDKYEYNYKRTYNYLQDRIKNDTNTSNSNEIQSGITIGRYGILSFLSR